MISDPQPKQPTDPTNPALKPMGWGPTLLYFGIPTLVFIGLFYGPMRWLLNAGWLPLWAYFVTIGGGLAAMLVASFIAYGQEGRPWTWPAIKERFRLHGFGWRVWLAIIGAWLVGSLAIGGWHTVTTIMYVNGLLPNLDWLPGFLAPYTTLGPEALFTEFFGVLQGNWLVVFAFFILLCFNIFGEELWWRGVILPRQELAFGRWTWVIHGSLWALFHAFKFWDVIALLPITLLLTLIAVRTRNSTPGIVLHWLVNGLSLIPLILIALS